MGGFQIYLLKHQTNFWFDMFTRISKIRAKEFIMTVVQVYTFGIKMVVSVTVEILLYKFNPLICFLTETL